MEWLLFAVLATLAAILFNYGAPKISNTAFAQKYQGSYAGRTGITAVSFFVVLLVAALLMSLAGERSPIPTAR